MWEHAARTSCGTAVRACETGHWVHRLERDGDHVAAVHARTSRGDVRITADNFVNTMALSDLSMRWTRPQPEAVRQAAARLRYRDFLIVALVLDDKDPFPDNWIYVHSDSVQGGADPEFPRLEPRHGPERSPVVDRDGVFLQRGRRSVVHGGCRSGRAGGAGITHSSGSPRPRMR